MIVSIGFGQGNYSCSKRFVCLECKQRIRWNHFWCSYRCLICYYKTNCAWNFFNHVVEEHSKEQPKCGHQPKLSNIILNHYQTCLCGFHSNNGMEIAAHLACCKTCSSSITVDLSNNYRKRLHGVKMSSKFLNRSAGKHQMKNNSKDDLSFLKTNKVDLSPRYVRSTPRNSLEKLSLTNLKLSPIEFRKSPIVRIHKIEDELQNSGESESYYSVMSTLREYSKINGQQ